MAATREARLGILPPLIHLHIALLCAANEARRMPPKIRGPATKGAARIQ